MIHWSLRPRSCFLNFVPDVWGRLGYEIHSERDLSLRGGGIHICIFSKKFLLISFRKLQDFHLVPVGLLLLSCN